MPPPAKPAAKIRVLCVDDAEDLPEMLGNCIAAEPDMECAGCLHTADDLPAEVRRTRAQVVLLDLSMPGTDPLLALREVAAAAGTGRPSGRGRSPDSVRVIAYSGRRDKRTMDLAINSGAWGFISKSADIPTVLRAIRAVAQGNTAFEGVDL